MSRSSRRCSRVRLLTGTARAIARHRLGAGPTPLSVTLAPTNRCAGRCDYCGIWRGNHESERSSSWWVDLLEDLHRRGCRRVGFTGGEPLQFEELDRVVARGKELGMLLSLGTNGVLVPTRQDLVSQLDYLVVSVDGPAEIADQQRFPGAHDAAMEAIQVARSLNVASWITVVVTQRVADRLDEVLAWARAHDLRLNLQLPFHPEPYCGQDNRRFFPAPPAVKDLIQRVLPESQPGGPVLNSPAYWAHVDNWAHIEARRFERAGPNLPRFPPCLAGRLFHHVEPDGRLYPCTHLVGDFDALDASAGKALDTALRHAASHGCLSCLSSYAQEQNLLFGLSPSAVGSWLRSIAAMLAS